MMEKALFEQCRGSYSQQGNYVLPDVKLPKQNYCDIGIWGQCCRQYLKQHYRIKYYNMLTQCTRYLHLADVEQQAQEMFPRLADLLSEKEDVTEKRNTENQMLWVQRMNNI